MLFYNFHLTIIYQMCYFIYCKTDEKEEVHLKCISQRVAGGGIATDGSRMEWAFEGDPNRWKEQKCGREDGEDTSLQNQVYAGIS